MRHFVPRVPWPLRDQLRKFKALQVAVGAAPEQQISLTDPDSRSMATSGKGTSVVGYIVKTAVATSPDRGVRGHQYRQ